MKPSLLSPLAVAAEGLSIKCGSATILEDVNLYVKHPSFCVIAGLNGAGKSTLLKALAGLAPDPSKQVRIFGRPAKDMARSCIAYVPERVQLVGHLTPLENAEYVLSLSSDAGYDEGLVRRCFASLGLTAESLAKPLHTLSKGTAQRAALAIAFGKPHQLLLLDEPLSGLDKASRQLVSALLASHKAAGHSIVAVTHDIYSLFEAIDHIVFLKDGRVDKVVTREVAGSDFVRMLDECVDYYLDDLQGPGPSLDSAEKQVIGAF